MHVSFTPAPMPRDARPGDTSSIRQSGQSHPAYLLGLSAQGAVMQGCYMRITPLSTFLTLSGSQSEPGVWSVVAPSIALMR